MKKLLFYILILLLVLLAIAASLIMASAIQSGSGIAVLVMAAFLAGIIALIIFVHRKICVIDVEEFREKFLPHQNTKNPYLKIHLAKP